MNEKPTAVISGARRGALRKRPVATNSIADVDGRAEDRGDHEGRQPGRPAIERRPVSRSSRDEDGDDRRVLAIEPAEHEDVAVGEVDQLEDPVDERVAERDQRVDEPFVSPIRKTLKKSVGALIDVHDQPRRRAARAKPTPMIERAARPLRCRTACARRRLFGTSFGLRLPDSRTTREGISPPPVGYVSCG